MDKVKELMDKFDAYFIANGIYKEAIQVFNIAAAEYDKPNISIEKMGKIKIKVNEKNVFTCPELLFSKYVNEFLHDLKESTTDEELYDVIKEAQKKPFKYFAQNAIQWFQNQSFDEGQNVNT